MSTPKVTINPFNKPSTLLEDREFHCPNPDCGETYNPFGNGGRIVVACCFECAQTVKRGANSGRRLPIKSTPVPGVKS